MEQRVHTTSPSDDPGSGSIHPGRVVIAFLVSFLAACVLVATVDWRHALPGRAPSVARVPPFERPTDPSAVYGGIDDLEVGKLALYHDLGQMIDRAREADILIFGTSRMQLGLREEFIVPRAEAAGLRVFSLASGHAEGTRFPLDVLRKHDLRPKIVIASGGPHLFDRPDDRSEAARAVQALSRFDAMKTWLEIQGGWALRSRLHALLPQVSFFERRLRTSWIVYLSTRTGWWQPAREPDGHYPVAFAPAHGDERRLLPVARELQQEVESRGAMLVLTIVPYGDTRAGHLAFLARELDVATVVPRMDDLTTADGSHLDRASAERISARFWEALMARNDVHERLASER